MKLKQSFHLLLIALFVWSFQTISIHMPQHLHEEEATCQLCDISEYLDLHHNESIPLVVNENIAVKTNREVEQVIVNERFDHKDIPQLKYVKIAENRHCFIGFTPLGFDATAPPIHFS